MQNFLRSYRFYAHNAFAQVLNVSTIAVIVSATLAQLKENVSSSSDLALTGAIFATVIVCLLGGVYVLLLELRTVKAMRTRRNRISALITQASTVSRGVLSAAAARAEVDTSGEGFFRKRDVALRRDGIEIARRGAHALFVRCGVCQLKRALHSRRVSLSTRRGCQAARIVTYAHPSVA